MDGHTEQNVSRLDDTAVLYDNAKAYWQNIECTVNGMMGGFAHLSAADVSDSRRFLRKIMAHLKISQRSCALDCGSGIGRVSKYVLLPIFDEVDLVDVTQSFLDASTSYVGPDLNKKIQRRICSGLQDFVPESGRYNVIWTQWVASQLSDDDLIRFLRRCRDALKFSQPTDEAKPEGGVMILKENVSSSDDGDFDKEDNSWARSYKVWMDIFHGAGLKVIKEKKQTNFSKDMYEVRMFALL